MSERNNPNGEPRIIGGHVATRNTTKHQVSIRLLAVDSADFGAGHFCGGSLINNKTGSVQKKFTCKIYHESNQPFYFISVLTACHCLVDKK